MEKQGLPNAGLYDQHAALQWIQDYIGLLGGDKSQVRYTSQYGWPTPANESLVLGANQLEPDRCSIN